MQDAVFIRSGHGYESGSYGRCDAFDGYTILADPLPGYDARGRDSRVFRRQSNGYGGVCYGAYTVKLAVKDGDYLKDLYLLVQHGAGREVWRMPNFSDGGALQAALVALPERELFALLLTIYKTASYARRQAEQETAQRWGEAFAEGRLKKRRAARGRPARIEIEPRGVIAAE
jgi:hypothetical protein